MDPLTYENLYRNPAVLEALERQARCERAEAMYRLVVLPLRRLLSFQPEADLRAPCAARSY
jgi:hypothetical protein